MKITREDILEYRRLQKMEWHTSAWVAKMQTKRMEAIGYADSLAQPGTDYKDIALSAVEYLTAIQ